MYGIITLEFLLILNKLQICILNHNTLEKTNSSPSDDAESVRKALRYLELNSRDPNLTLGEILELDRLESGGINYAESHGILEYSMAKELYDLFHKRERNGSEEARYRILMMRFKGINEACLILGESEISSPDVELFKVLKEGGVQTVKIGDRYSVAGGSELGGKASLGVLLAWDEVLARFVVLKRYLSKKGGEKGEKLMAKINHPNILKVYDHLETGGIHYVVLPYLSNKDYSSIEDLQASEYVFMSQEIVAILHALKEALSYLSEEGISHYDLNTGNLMYGYLSIILIDFGYSVLDNSNKKSHEKIIKDAYKNNIEEISYFLRRMILKTTEEKRTEPKMISKMRYLSKRGKIESYNNPVFFSSLNRILAEGNERKGGISVADYVDKLIGLFESLV